MNIYNNMHCCRKFSRCLSKLYKWMFSCCLEDVNYSDDDNDIYIYEKEKNNYVRYSVYEMKKKDLLDDDTNNDQTEKSNDTAKIIIDMRNVDGSYEELNDIQNDEKKNNSNNNSPANEWEIMDETYDNNNQEIEEHDDNKISSM
jgi:hypothetical protein